MPQRPTIRNDHIWMEIEMKEENLSRMAEWSLLSTSILEQLISENPGSYFIIRMDGSVGIRKDNTAYNRTR